MKLQKPQLASLALRIGLAFVFVYGAVGSLMHPDLWVGYLPPFIQRLSEATTILRAFAVIELGLSVWLLSGKFVRYAAGLAALFLVGIVLAQPSALIVTFRDVGLIFMALALALT